MTAVTLADLETDHRSRLGGPRGRVPRDPRRGPQRRRDSAVAARLRPAPGSPRDGRRRLDHASVAEEGRAAVLPAERQRHHARRRPGSAARSAPGGTRCPTSSATGPAPHFKDAGFRAVPGSIVRRGAFIGRNVVLMPSFVNIGAYVDEGSMVDAWATVGSCAQIGKNVHLSRRRRHRRGAGTPAGQSHHHRGRLLHRRPLRSGRGRHRAPGRRAVDGRLSAATTKIVDRTTGEVHRGEVPAYSVVVPGSLPDPNGGPVLYCAVIVKTRRRPDPGQDLDQRTAAGLAEPSRFPHGCAQGERPCNV